MSGRLLCLFLPNFRLRVAAGALRRWGARPLALLGRGGRVGEVSPLARSLGVVEGMRLEEALACLPRLRLLPPDPRRSALLWEEVVAALEGVGGAVERRGEGVAYLAVLPLLSLYRSPAGVVAAVRKALGAVLPPSAYRLGLGKSRFYALLGATLAPPGGWRELGPSEPAAEQLPLGVVALKRELAPLVAELGELGLATLGAVRAVGKGPLEERFGPPGALLYDLLAGAEPPLSPQPPSLPLEESLELEGSSDQGALEAALAVLLDRLRARREWGGRTVRLLSLSARLAGGGSFSKTVTFRHPTASRRLLLARACHALCALPAPPLSLSLRVERFGPPLGRQLSLGGGEERPGLAEALAHLQAVVGREGVVRVVEAQEGAKVPERRFLVAPAKER